MCETTVTKPRAGPGPRRNPKLHHPNVNCTLLHPESHTSDGGIQSQGPSLDPGEGPLPPSRSSTSDHRSGPRVAPLSRVPTHTHPGPDRWVRLGPWHVVPMSSAVGDTGLTFSSCSRTSSSTGPTPWTTGSGRGSLYSTGRPRHTSRSSTHTRRLSPVRPPPSDREALPSEQPCRQSRTLVAVKDSEPFCLTVGAL